VKPYNELTRLGQLRRTRRLAKAALDAYGLNGARLKFVQYSANIVYRVDVPTFFSVRAGPGPYAPNRYLLRVLYTDHLEGVRGEMTWLAALSREAGLPVPEPVPTLEGDLVISIATPEVPQGRIVSLMRWIDGRRLTKGFRPDHFRAWGRIAARLHQFSAGWRPPEGFERPVWGWEGQLGGRYFDGGIEELVASMPKRLREPFQIVSQEARQVMEGLGKGSDAYGLIHADMYPENVLFKGDEAYPIDFEDCGFGYWLWEIAIALCVWPWTEEWYWMRDAFLEGYVQVRTLPESQLKHLDLFMATQYATMVLWASLFIKNDPARRAEHEEWRNRDGAKLLRYLERR
jgi:Ser/Thr protein kinase RdoA (MazF antagonist)